MSYAAKIRACHGYVSESISVGAEADAEIAALRKRAEEAEADTRRLEWWLTCSRPLHMHKGRNGWSVSDASNGLVFLSRNEPTMRDAIDAALACLLTTNERAAIDAARKETTCDS